MYKRMIKRRVLSVLGALVFLFMVSACGIAEEESYSRISAEEAKKIMEAGGRIEFISFVEGKSTTSIIEKMRK